MDKAKPIKPVTPGDVEIDPVDDAQSGDVAGGGPDRPDPFIRGLGTDPAQK